MKFLLYTDNHFSKYSSILRSRGIKYSKRLENQIQCLNWVEQIAWDRKLDAIVCLGDFFDSSSLDAEEISALKDVCFSYISHIFLVGNHELGTSANDFNSANLFSLIDNNTVIRKPKVSIVDRTLILFLPYILENQRELISTYLPNNDEYDKVIILSHNDLKDVQYGGYVSKVGYSIGEIEANCDLFINGHIHNGGWVTNKILNLGNLTGQNFSEDGSKHQIAILDTDTLEIELIDNPSAIYFDKLTYTNESLSDIDVEFSHLSVVSATCNENYSPIIHDYLSHQENVLDYRVVVNREIKKDTSKNVQKNANVKEQFVNGVYDKIGKSQMIDEELGEILR